jgi:GTP-binding protein LepA
MEQIRNFSIIAHIDHGKSTLADRLLEFTGALSRREMTDQVLDTMELERERGITIKAQTARITYKCTDEKEYILNLIDTPGHVDFSYEVSRSLAACDGVLLVVDASQGIQAQTIANINLAIEHNLEIIPIINKIDLPNADPENVKKQIEDVLHIDSSESILVSAKNGTGIKEVLEAITVRIPPPRGEKNAHLKVLIVDSWYDIYQGVVLLVKVFDGVLKKGMAIKLMATKKTTEVDSLGVFAPTAKTRDQLMAGEVGFLIPGLKDIKDTKIGDTVTSEEKPISTALPGYKDAKPMVFCGLYPVDNSQFDFLRDSLEKLHLNDSSFVYEPETSKALGFGFRCGFLGLLHLEIVRERLEREYSLKLITTAPTVVYLAVTVKGETITVENPSNMPLHNELSVIKEPFIEATIITPAEFIGPVLKLAQDRRGMQKSLKYLNDNLLVLIYELPLNEMVFDFNDRLKSISKGYASFDYEYLDYRPSKLAKLDILINGDSVDALSLIVHKEKAYYVGRELVKKMRNIIHRQMFEVVIQAAIGSKVICRDTVKALRKNVTAKCYGGDITRKRKLLEKQKEGKKRMKQVGKISIPQEAFWAILSTDN